MRILYLDIDSLRPDHLGCYGYQRATSPTIDSLAAQGVRFDRCYVSDSPCLPSRTALWSGKRGFHTGVIGHGGTTAQPYVEGMGRGPVDYFRRTGWMSLLRQAGLRTATISSFADRHAAWHWYAGYMDIHDTGRMGRETADEVTALAEQWLQHNAAADDWFLHVNFWDPHTPYRTPLSYGEPFAADPLPAWLTPEVWEQYWEGYGPNSLREPIGFEPIADTGWPRWPAQLNSFADIKAWYDGYDTAIRYVDDHIALLLDTLERAGVLDETAVIVSADHGESLGEGNIWADHHLADDITCRVPLIVRWPGVPPHVDRALHYQFDWSATVVELVGGSVPEEWDGRPFTDAFRGARSQGKPYVVLSQAAWTCARSVRWDRYLCMRTYHNGYADLEPIMLFDLEADPHEQTDLAGKYPHLVDHAMSLLAEWHHRMMVTNEVDVDPMMTVLREGGPYYTRYKLKAYLARLHASGREAAARRLLERQAAYS